MNTKQVDLLWIEDPGHAWLRMKLADFLKLGVSKDITDYSYITAPEAPHDRYVYLEEDCDAHVAIQKMKNLGWKMVMNDTYVDDFERSHYYSYMLYFNVDYIN